VQKQLLRALGSLPMGQQRELAECHSHLVQTLPFIDEETGSWREKVNCCKSQRQTLNSSLLAPGLQHFLYYPELDPGKTTNNRAKKKVLERMEKRISGGGGFCRSFFRCL
jgi:hypothetical protein